jgi:hypothetical protein
MCWLANPAPSLGSCTCGKPALDAEAVDDGRDVAADGGRADPHTVGDGVVVQSLGHQLQHRLLRRCQAITRRRGP